MAIDCAAPQCDRDSVKRGHCDTHYRHIRRYGEVRPVRYLRTDRKVCTVCGAVDWPDNGRRSQCSARCQQLHRRNGGGPVPTSKACDRCGGPIDLTIQGRAGRKKRSDSRLCGNCYRAKYVRHHVSVSTLARRDGTNCGICSEPIDMNLGAPDLFRASVDHVIPFAIGGTHDPSNLQLAHLWCNQVKRDRPNFHI